MPTAGPLEKRFCVANGDSCNTVVDMINNCIDESMHTEAKKDSPVLVFLLMKCHFLRECGLRVKD